MLVLAQWMKRAVEARDDERALKTLKEEVKHFALSFPLPSDLSQ
jgi:glycine/serine hydroxymethyltransferase